MFFGFCGDFFFGPVCIGPRDFFFGSSIVIGIYIGLDIFGFWYFLFWNRYIFFEFGTGREI